MKGQAIVLGSKFSRLTALALAPLLAANAATGPRIEKARAILEEHLVDYSGAKVRKAVLIDTGDTVSICAEVNSPNRAGGMSGWQQTAIIVEGRDYAPMMQVGTNGYSGLSEYRKFCPFDVEKTAWAEGEDLSPALQPVAN